MTDVFTNWDTWYKELIPMELPYRRVLAEYGINAIEDVVRAIVAEMDRQIRLKDAGKFKYLASEMPPFQMQACLSEECGEVARAINDNQTPDHLAEELIQVASVAVSAWLGIKAHQAEGTPLISTVHSGRLPRLGV